MSAVLERLKARRERALRVLNSPARAPKTVQARALEAVGDASRRSHVQETFLTLSSSFLAMVLARTVEAPCR